MKENTASKNSQTKLLMILKNDFLLGDNQPFVAKIFLTVTKLIVNNKNQVYNPYQF